MNPMGFNRVEPGAFLGKQKDKQSDIALLFGLLIIVAYPGFDLFTLVPTSLIPDDDEHALILLASDIEQTGEKE